MRTMIVLFLSLVIVSPSALAETLEERIKLLEGDIKRQEEMLKNQQKSLDELKEQSKQPKPAEPPPGAPLPTRDYRLDDRSRAFYLSTTSPLTPYPLTQQTSPSLLNPAISFILDTFYYHSSLSKDELATRNIPGFIKAPEPLREGFNLRSLEFLIFAPVDPYFNLYIRIPFTEDKVELEEAYFVTTSLPVGVQIKGGKFRSGFGRFNAFHPHTWDFVDAPLPYTLFFGNEGLIEKGVQLTYLPNLPIYVLFGAEVLQGENELLFGAEAQSGPHAYAGFAKASLDFGTNHTILFGGSVIGGKAKTDSFAQNTEFRGDAILYGAEFTYKWKPSSETSFILQSEYLYRDQKGDLFDSASLTTDPFKRAQDGLYIYGIYQFERWRIGARYDRMDIFKDEVIQAGEKRNFAGQPYRWTGSLEFNPTEFSRIRLQYNYDKSAGAEKENHEIFLQFILAVGANVAHSF